MNYISLFELMRYYGTRVREMKSGRTLNSSIESSFNHQTDYRPFDIRTDRQDDGHVCNTLSIRTVYKPNTYWGRGQLGAQYPKNIMMPPILETEWIASVMGLPQDQKELLTQLAYEFVIYVLSWEVEMHSNVGTEWTEHMRANGILMDVDSMEDVPEILAAVKMNFPPSSMHRVKTWYTVIAYGTGFSDVYAECSKRSTFIGEVYLHLPVLLSLFMCDYCQNKMADWSKADRLNMENELSGLIANLNGNLMGNVNGIVESDRYTYAVTTRLTSTDIRFIRSMVTLMFDRLHELNADIGTINYGNYTIIKGPEHIRACVRLTGMKINWKEEMSRDKKGNEETDESHEEEYEDVFDDDGDYEDEDEEEWD